MYRVESDDEQEHRVKALKTDFFFDKFFKLSLRRCLLHCDRNEVGEFQGRSAFYFKVLKKNKMWTILKGLDANRKKAGKNLSVISYSNY